MVTVFQILEKALLCQLTENLSADFNVNSTKATLLHFLRRLKLGW
jgi:hypothetical protein